MKELTISKTNFRALAHASSFACACQVLILLVFISLFAPSIKAQNVGIAGDKQGLYFSKKTYSPKQTPPKFAEIKDKLPAPIYDDNPDLVKMYWRAWEIAGDNFYEPNAQNGFVSPYIDATFNGNIFFWDTAFMTMFLNYADGLTPGISSLDNFYAKQHEAYKLNYSSVAHLSNQFKKITGLTPSGFKHLRLKKRHSLENI